MPKGSPLRRVPVRVGTAVICAATPILLTPVAATAAPGQPSWHTVQSMPEGRSEAAFARLGDGRVLLAGGVLGTSSAATATAETYSPSTNSWSPVADMPTPRQQATGLTLQDGRAMVLGGFSNTADIFDPATDTWTSTGTYSVDDMAQGTATLLQDGRVLLAGGDTCDVHGICQHLAAAELFDPATNAWTPTGSMHVARALAASFLLADGRVLLVGGVCNADLDPCDTNPAPTAEIFNPADGSWTYTNKPLVTPALPTLIDSGDHRNPLLLGGGNVVQRYDAATNSWSVAPPAPCDYGSQAFGETTTALFGSRSTVVAGLTSCEDAMPNVAMLYRPTLGWTLTGTNFDHALAFALVTLADGRVMIAGGGNGDGVDPPAAKTAEIFG